MQIEVNVEQLNNVNEAEPVLQALQRELERTEQQRQEKVKEHLAHIAGLQTKLTEWRAARANANKNIKLLQNEIARYRRHAQHRPKAVTILKRRILSRKRHLKRTAVRKQTAEFRKQVSKLVSLHNNRQDETDQKPIGSLRRND